MRGVCCVIIIFKVSRDTFNFQSLDDIVILVGIRCHKGFIMHENMEK